MKMYAAHGPPGVYPTFILHVILCVMSLRDVNCTGWIALVEVLKTMSLFLFTARLAEFQERLDGET